MTLVNATCARCGATLAPGFANRLRCPRLAACGYGGLVENRTAADQFRVTRLFEALLGRGPRGPTPVAAA